MGSGCYNNAIDCPASGLKIIGRDRHDLAGASSCSIIFVAGDTLDRVPGRLEDFGGFR
jgi:hypothetical protein